MAGNRIEAHGEVTFAHDANGNVVSKTTGYGTTTYEYDYENRLSRAIMPDGTVAEYGYGPLGRRVEKRVGGEVRRYFYDGEDIVAEYGGGGGLAARYTHGPGIDEPLAMERGGRTYYYHADALGSIKAITDGEGSVVQRYSYDAFGAMAYVENPLFVQPYAYTGREQDPETGLYYLRARYYDSGMGRFLSEDPIGFAGGDVNLYRYVGNNQVNFTDPWGLETWTCQRPLNTGSFDTSSPSGRKNIFDASWNPAYHQFLCTNDPSTGKIICSSQYPGPSILGYSPFGLPGNDQYSDNLCTETHGDNKCLERCLSWEFTKQRPPYTLLGPGTNCQEWSTSTLSDCVSKCK